MSANDKLMRRLARLEKAVRRQASTPRLGNSSIDSGALVVNHPVTGATQVIIGQQGDGTSMVNHVNGPTPPQPTVPVLEGHLGFIKVTWDGLYTNDDVTPLDFSRVEVHASTDPEFEVDPTLTLRATVESAGGGDAAIGVPYDQEFHVRLVTRSLSGKGSIPSDSVAGEARKVDTPDIEPFAVQAGSIADFALAVTKFNTLQHMIY